MHRTECDPTLTIPSPRRHVRAAVLAVSALLLIWADAAAGQSRFSHTDSRSQYVHWIPLRDATEREIDPTSPNPPPYSPAKTCGKCHDYKAISQGFHFNAADQPGSDESPVIHGRPGEPWFFLHPKSGSSMPLSYRGWPGTLHPSDAGLKPLDFIVTFGRHLPGGLPRESQLNPPKAETAPTAEASATEDQPDAPADAAEPPPPDRFKISGHLDIDCMICHSADRSYSPERWLDQIESQNFAWAPTAALGLAKIEGSAKSLPDDFDPTKAAADGSGPQLPRTIYRADRFDADKNVFFDVIRKPTDNACYYCHSTRPAGHGAGAKWQHDEDVHLRAGMSCTDCHRNAIGHHTVRAYEGEKHPTGQSVQTLSCRGCHMPADQGGGDDQHAPGRLGSPLPLHKGIPPIHFQVMSCTSCHSGTNPTDEAQRWQTAMAHELGLPTHDRTPESAPPIVAPVIMKDEDGIYYPYRMTWPSYWGKLEGDAVKPLDPEAVYDAIRRPLRLRGTFAEAILKNRALSKPAVREAVLGADRAEVDEDDWTEADKANVARFAVAQVIEILNEELGEADYVYISGGKAYRLPAKPASAKDDESATEEEADAVVMAEVFDHPAAQPYSWKLGHDVRPARWSLGVKGCAECHSDGAAFFNGKVTAVGTLPDDQPITHAMHDLQDVDAARLAAWNQSFQGRDTFKWIGFISIGAVALLLLLYVLVGLNGLLRLIGIGRKA